MAHNEEKDYEYPLGGVHLKHAPKPTQKLTTISGTLPITLLHTLPRKPDSITLYGNTVGVIGVGDKTANIWRTEYGSSNTKTVPVNYGQTYTMSFIPDFPPDATGGNRHSLILYDENMVQIGQTSYPWWNGKDTNGVLQIVKFTITNAAVRYARYTLNATRMAYVMLTEGNYNASTNCLGIAAYPLISATDGYLQQYEQPDVYKITLCLGSNNINIFTDTQLYENDTITITGDTWRTMRGNTDITSLQNTTQDLTLPKASYVTVTTGTEILPAHISISYYSKGGIYFFIHPFSIPSYSPLPYSSV